MKAIGKKTLLLGALALVLTLCLAVSAQASAGDKYVTLENGTTVRLPEGSPLELMQDGDEEQDPSLPQLSAPRTPVWGINYPYCYRNLEDGTQDKTWESIPGIASWTMGQLSQNEFAVYFYRVNPDENPEQGELIDWGIWYVSENAVAEGNVWSVNFFLDNVRETGDYYFIVKALGDGVHYRDSEGVKSPLWHFDAPDARLPTPPAPVWSTERNEEGQWVVHFDPGDSEAVFGREVQFYYAPDLESNPLDWEVGSIGIPQAEGECPLKDFVTKWTGAGYYYASVQYRSRDITKAQLSEESPLSEPIYISAAYGKDLEGIVSGVSENSNEDEIRQAVNAVRDLNTGKLAEAMWADTDNTAAAAQIKTLEELARTTASVNVSDGMSGVFDKDKVSMIGAGLNVAPGKSVTLNINQPDDASGVIPTMYANAVQFSMHLTGNNGDLATGEDGRLAVPIKLTLPIPEGINPDFLVIMHRHADGTYEELSVISDIIITQVDGQYYATFMVRSFSDFVFAERTQLTAEKTADGVKVTLKANPGSRTLTAALAVYDARGKQLGVALAPLTGSTLTKPVPCDPSEADHVRVMILDSWKPAEAARTVDVS